MFWGFWVILGYSGIVGERMLLPGRSFHRGTKSGQPFCSVSSFNTIDILGASWTIPKHPRTLPNNSKQHLKFPPEIS